MKAFAVPTAAAGLAAGLSVLFFTGISHAFGDRMLGQIILLQASVALIQMATVPQGWLYIIGSRDPETLRRRYSIALTTEVAGIGLGLAVLLVALALPFGFITGWREGALLMYFSLVIQASSSCLGLLRANEDWSRYMLWVLASNLVRVPLVWALPALEAAGVVPASIGPTAIIFYLFLLPDLVRWLLIYLPLALRHYHWPGRADTLAGARTILQNWFFDVGSAITEVGDKIVVGALLGPVTLVPYFFARKLAIVATMAVEPFYAEHYRRVLGAAPISRPPAERRIYRHGLSLALGLASAMTLALAMALQLPFTAALLPGAVTARIGIFIVILAIDCGMAANRWSRYVAQERGNGRLLFGVRMLLFATFVAGIALFGNAFGGFGLCLAFGTVWVLEASFLAWLMRDDIQPTAPPPHASQAK